MKTKLIIGAIVLSILVVAGITVWTQADTDKVDVDLSLCLPRATASADVTYELAAEDLPTEIEMMIYKVKNPVITTDAVQKIGAGLGFTGGTGLIDRDTKYAMLDETQDETRQLSIWVNSGAVEYAIVYPDKLYPTKPPELPSWEKAKTIAIDFLQQFGLWPFDTSQNDVEVISGGTYQVINTSTDEVIEKYDTHLLVRADRFLSIYKVVGPGIDLSVRIGDKGEVLKVFKCWRVIEPYMQMRIKTPLEAYEELKSGLGVSIAPVECQNVVITKISLAYWMDPMDQVQEHVLPVYVFEGECSDSNGNFIELFEGYCEALVK